MSLQTGPQSSKWLQLSDSFTLSQWCRNEEHSCPSQEMCPAAGITRWHSQPLIGGLLRQLCLGISSRKRAQLLNLQLPYIKRWDTAAIQEMRSAVCPAPAEGIARGLMGSPWFLPAGIAGVSPGCSPDFVPKSVTEHVSLCKPQQKGHGPPCTVQIAANNLLFILIFLADDVLRLLQSKWGRKGWSISG